MSSSPSPSPSPSPSSSPANVLPLTLEKKLTRDEWLSTERPVPSREALILSLIASGFSSPSSSPSSSSSPSLSPSPSSVPNTTALLCHFKLSDVADNDARATLVFYRLFDPALHRLFKRYPNTTALMHHRYITVLSEADTTAKPHGPRPSNGKKKGNATPSSNAAATRLKPGHADSVDLTALGLGRANAIRLQRATEAIRKAFDSMSTPSTATTNASASASTSTSTSTSGGSASKSSGGAPAVYEFVLFSAMEAALQAHAALQERLDTYREDRQQLSAPARRLREALGQALYNLAQLTVAAPAKRAALFGELEGELLHMRMLAKACHEELAKACAWSLDDTLACAAAMLEGNPLLQQLRPLRLYPHQSQLFELFRTLRPPATRLVLYSSPTGTGKTLSPLGLAAGYRVIYVCASRSVALALARSAVAANRKVALYFGKKVRLHHLAVPEDETAFKRDARSSRKYHVDNTRGENVELLICDVQSCVAACEYLDRYRASGNPLLLYWDEPTIALDHPTHPLHAMIEEVWRHCTIGNIVLSSATLPRLDGLGPMVASYRAAFPAGDVAEVRTTSFLRSVSLLTRDGHTAVPHTLYTRPDQYPQWRACLAKCDQNRTLLRYMDVHALCEGIHALLRLEQAERDASGADEEEDGEDDEEEGEDDEEEGEGEGNEDGKAHGGSDGEVARGRRRGRLFQTPEFQKLLAEEKRGLLLGNLSMPVAKAVYLKLALALDPAQWAAWIQAMQTADPPLDCFHTTIGTQRFLREDAYTLTDGPTIYLTDRMEEVARRCWAQIEDTIPPDEGERILKGMVNNRRLREAISALRTQLQDALGEEPQRQGEDGYVQGSGRVVALQVDIERLTGQMQRFTLRDVQVPNRADHLLKWCKVPSEEWHGTPFSTRVTENDIHDAMALQLGERDWLRLLLLAGVGVLFDTDSAAADAELGKYCELVRRLADEQRLFLIVAGSDHIYGTNYAFCHGYLAEDLLQLTEEKIIQAFGRVGRQAGQRFYTLRIQDTAILQRLFTPQAEGDKPECIMMNRLFRFQGKTGEAEAAGAMDAETA